MMTEDTERRDFYSAWFTYCASGNRKAIEKFVTTFPEPRSTEGICLRFALSDISFERPENLSEEQKRVTSQMRGYDPLISQLLFSLSLDPDPKFSGRAMVLLSWIGTPYAASALSSIALYHRFSHQRGTAVVLIGETDGEWTVDILRKACEDSDVSNSSYAAMYLGLRGELRPIEILVRSISNKMDSHVLETVARVVATLGERQLVDECAKRIRDEFTGKEEEAALTVLRETRVHSRKNEFKTARSDQTEHEHP
ncbi:MAG: hypothetical protein FJW35_06120 [Acidobacteria bacterium]|nr:hypothetical protein [Acidobacteriota bacterium]